MSELFIKCPTCQTVYERQTTRGQLVLKTAPEVEQLRRKLNGLLHTIEDDGFAMTFQTMGQYRTELARLVRAALASRATEGTK